MNELNVSAQIVVGTSCHSLSSENLHRIMWRFLGIIRVVTGGVVRGRVVRGRVVRGWVVRGRVVRGWVVRGRVVRGWVVWGLVVEN